MHHIYFAKSLKNNKVYVGRTDKNPLERVQEHNNGANNWSRQNKPLRLIYYESFVCKEDSVKKELFYKTGIGKRIKRAVVAEMEKTA